MQGLANFAQVCALILALLLPTFLYCSALGLFMFAGWGFWQQAQPGNPFRGKPWIPWVSLLLSGFCASFPAIITKVNISGGSDVTLGVVAGLSSYTAMPNTAGLLGATPGATVVNVVQIFLPFFQIFGAITCFFAAMSWRASVTGLSQHPWSRSGIKFVFGMLLMNIFTITQFLVGIFQPKA